MDSYKIVANVNYLKLIRLLMNVRYITLSIRYTHHDAEFPMFEPFFAAIWCGKSKPPCKEYLEPFISEMKDLMSEGLIVNSHLIKVKFGFCVCDTPARALIKGIVYEQLMR